MMKGIQCRWGGGSSCQSIVIVVCRTSHVVRCTALHSAFCMSSVEWCTFPVVCCLSVACWLLHIACGMLSVACCVRLCAAPCMRAQHASRSISHTANTLRVRTRRCLPSTPPELAPHLPTPQHACSMHVVAVLVTLIDFGILSETFETFETFRDALCAMGVLCASITRTALAAMP